MTTQEVFDAGRLVATKAVKAIATSKPKKVKAAPPTKFEQKKKREPRPNAYEGGEWSMSKVRERERDRLINVKFLVGDQDAFKLSVTLWGADIGDCIGRLNNAFGVGITFQVAPNAERA